MVRNDAGFATVYHKLYCRQVLELSRQASLGTVFGVGLINIWHVHIR